MPITSDRGETLRDHGWAKDVYYQPSIGVPLVVSGLGVRHGVRSPTLVPLQDVPGTLLDYASADALPEMEAAVYRLRL